MTRFFATNLDLSLLAPPVLQDTDFERIYDERIGDLVPRLDEAGIIYDTGKLNNNGAARLQATDAYREMLDLQAINDATRRRMLAYSYGPDLDHLGALYGMARITLIPADEDAGTPAVMESDEEFRARVQLAPEQFSRGGTVGSYRSLVLQSTPGLLADVRLSKRPGGYVDVILLAKAGDGTVSDAVTSQVYTALNGDDAAPFTDIITVRSAEIVTYTVTATLLVPRGPDPQVAVQAARRNLAAYVASRRKVGALVARAGLEGACMVANVINVALVTPFAGDLIVEYDQSAYCTDIAVGLEYADD